jgi:hypothetical protein
MFTVTEINHAARLSELRTVWRTLWQRTPRASFFQTREWLECFLYHFGDDYDLRTLLVSSGARPVGIVPLIARRVGSRLGPVRALTYPLGEWGAFYGPIGRNPSAVLTGALQHVAMSRRNWELIDLRSVEPAAGDAAQTGDALAAAGFAAVERTWSAAAIIDFDGHSAGDRFGLRRKLQSAERELWRRGPWELVRHRPDGRGAGTSILRSDLWTAADRLLEAQGRNVRELDFLRDSFEAAAWQGAADLSLVYLRGQPVGCLLAFAGNGQTDVVAGAFAAEHDELVQQVLVGRLLVDGDQRGERRFVFGPQQRELAVGWPAETVHSSRWTHFATFGARAQLLRFAQRRHTLVSA